MSLFDSYLNDGGYNMGSSYEFNNFGYNQQMGRTDKFGYTTYKKNEIIQGIRNFITYSTGKVPFKEEKIEETPQLLRHACAESETKISRLGMMVFDVSEMGITVPYYFCTACCKLYYPKEVV